VKDRKLASNGGSGSIVAFSVPDVVSFSDYYPYGMVMPNRKGNTPEYRYGFNGMEKDEELKGESNSYDFGARMYDSRVGRFLSRDPKTSSFPSISAYCFAANSPIKFGDVNGESPGDPVRLYISNANSYGHLPDGSRGPSEVGFWFNSAKKVQQEHIYKTYGEAGVQQIKKVWSGSGIVDYINSQSEGSIASIDIFSHGSAEGIWFYHNVDNEVKVSKGKTWYGVDCQKDNEYNGFYSKRSRYHQEKGIDPLMIHETKAGMLDQIDVTRFANDARIELHACETAGKEVVLSMR
jgi:RHS repeat-associated protein